MPNPRKPSTSQIDPDTDPDDLIYDPQPQSENRRARPHPAESDPDDEQEENAPYISEVQAPIRRNSNSPRGNPNNSSPYEKARLVREIQQPIARPSDRERAQQYVTPPQVSETRTPSYNEQNRQTQAYEESYRSPGSAHTTPRARSSRDGAGNVSVKIKLIKISTWVKDLRFPKEFQGYFLG